MNCPSCGAEVKRCETKAGRTVILDATAREFRGPHRYLIEDASTAVLISSSFETYAYGDHDKTCPQRIRDRERRERK